MGHNLYIRFSNDNIDILVLVTLSVKLVWTLEEYDVLGKFYGDVYFFWNTDAHNTPHNPLFCIYIY